MQFSKAVPTLSLLSLPLLLAGCGVAGSTSGTVHPGVAMSGSMHGGQQPVSGATIQLYAAGSTDKGGATALLTTTVTTDAHGGFNITGDYTCPVDDPFVYLVGTGGDPGIGSTNSAIGMMAALGRCSSLTPSTFIWMDEVTTVAAAAALAPYMTPPAIVGAADQNALAAAFQAAASYADTSHGSSPGVGWSGTPTTYSSSVPTSTINTLANIMASCINSASPTSTTCSQLSSLVDNSPDTLTAMVKLMQTPGAYDTGGLFALASATGPFQPQLSTAPPATFGVTQQPPTTDSAPAFVFPTTVSIGDAVWMVAKTYPPCLTTGSVNYLRLNSSVYTTPGQVACGTIWGYVPTGTPTGLLNTEWLSSAPGGGYNDYRGYVTVVSKPLPSAYFKPNAAFWEGDGVTHTSYGITVVITNYSNATITTGTGSIKGTDAVDFSVTQTYCDNTQVYSTGGCSVTLQFNPPDLGVHYATYVLPLLDSSGHTTYATVQLGGTGVFHYTGP